MKIVCSYCNTKVDKVKKVDDNGNIYIDCPKCKREMKALMVLKN